MDKSIGHKEFIGDYEYWISPSGDLYQAPISNPIMIDGRRCGRWEAPPHMVDMRLAMLRAGLEMARKEDIRKGNALKSISIVSRAVNEAIAHRAETLCRERGITMLDRCDGDWVGEFAETDNTMRTLHSVMTMLREARGKA